MTVTVEQLVKGCAGLAAALLVLVALPISFGARVLFLLIVCAVGFGIRKARRHGHFRLAQTDTRNVSGKTVAVLLLLVLAGVWAWETKQVPKLACRAAGGTWVKPSVWTDYQEGCAR